MWLRLAVALIILLFAIKYSDRLPVADVFFKLLTCRDAVFWKPLKDSDACCFRRVSRGYKLIGEIHAELHSDPNRTTINQ